MVTNKAVTAEVDEEGLVRIELPRNKTGLWFATLAVKSTGALNLLNVERFNVYGQPGKPGHSTEEQTQAMIRSSAS